MHPCPECQTGRRDTGKFTMLKQNIIKYTFNFSIDWELMLFQIPSSKCWFCPYRLYKYNFWSEIFSLSSASIEENFINTLLREALLMTGELGLIDEGGQIKSFFKYFLKCSLPHLWIFDLKLFEFLIFFNKLVWPRVCFIWLYSLTFCH